MKKWFRSMLCTALLAVAVCIPSFAAQSEVPTKQGDFYVLVNGQYVTFTDAVPQIRNDRSCLPFVAVLEQLGFAEKDMTWNGETSTVIATKDNTSIALTIGKNQISLTQNGKTSLIDTDIAPYIDPDQSRTYIPFGLVADTLGYHVGWDALQGTVIIDDVDAILAANKETYTVMDKYMAYSKTFYEKNQKITGNYAMDMSTNMSDASQNGSLGFAVDGKYEMLTAGATAFQFNTDMTMDVKATNGGSSVLDQMLTDEERAMFPLNIDLDMRGDMADGVFYFQSAALAKLVEQPDMANAWFKLDLASMFNQMSDVMGFGYGTLMELSTNSLNMSFEDSLEAMLRMMPLTDAELTTSDYLQMMNAVLADSAFKQSGTTYVSTLNQDGMVMTFTLYTNGSKVTGYAMDMTATDPAFGNSKISASMKDNKMEMSMKMDMAMSADPSTPMSITLDMTMDGTYQATSSKPATQPPANATVIDLMNMGI